MSDLLPTLPEIQRDILAAVTGGNPQSATEHQRRTAQMLTDTMIGYTERYNRWYGRITASLRDERDAWKRFANDLIEHHVNGAAARAKLWERYEDIKATDWLDTADGDAEPSTSTYPIRSGMWKAVVRANGRRKTMFFLTEKAADEWTDQMILAVRRGEWEV